MQVFFNRDVFYNQSNGQPIEELFFQYGEENGVKALQHIDFSVNAYLGNVTGSKVYTEVK